MKLRFWISFSLFNLVIVAMLGILLRTKFLFPIPFIDYKSILSAHSHFAFGGWVTLILMVLLVNNILEGPQREKRSYQFILWGINLSAWGMVLSFPFLGYGLLPIIFSTLFIFFTYGFAWVFIRDLLRAQVPGPVRLIGIGSMAYLVISSIGPFFLAKMIATGSGDAFLFRDSVYSFLHFQYNGFFTLAVMALFTRHIYDKLSPKTQAQASRFALFLVLSVVPAFFLTLLWRGYLPLIVSVAILACILISICLFFFFRLVIGGGKLILSDIPVARTLLVFSLTAFLIKMVLQMGTLVPALGKAVFGFRPIIIGFLHLVFLVMVSFYILSTLVRNGELNTRRPFIRMAVWSFFTAVLFNETVLLVDGIGLMFYFTHPIYPWLLWVASILLFVSALLVFIARLMNDFKKDTDHSPAQQ